MTAKMRLAIVGCGDFLRWQADAIRQSHLLEVCKLYDPREEAARRFAAQLGGEVVHDLDAIAEDSSIGLVALFVPPWVRCELFCRLARCGKHIITTKPLAPRIEEAEAIFRTVQETGIHSAVIYSRTGDAFVESLRELLQHGELGQLCLYRQDWIHAYPQWNRWAVDPKLNGGPFMDAMIHNLNAANYLMGRKITGSTLLSENLAHPQLACADTELMTVRYENGGLAHLFITWAADLAVYSREGNDREHIDLFYLVTDHGWRITRGQGNCAGKIVASRQGENRTFPVREISQTCYDGMVRYIRGESDFPPVLATVKEAMEDIATICRSRRI
ncbi:MAG: gfo/Idh/MocA family oxidoreductase [Lentisphaerae bacterium]|nr:MAG: gfo/Idh/MocA family oxidoreductase [Lentisphaerota bacterium]